MQEEGNKIPPKMKNNKNKIKSMQQGESSKNKSQKVKGREMPARREKKTY